MKKWYHLEASTKNPQTIELSIHDEIGAYGVTARDFIADFQTLASSAQEIHLSVHSPGGDVFDAFAIYHVLLRHKEKIFARVEGLAASAASLIVMAAGHLSIPENAYLMIHNPWSFSIGDAHAMRDVADLLDKVTASLANIYAHRSGQSEEEIKKLLDQETWMTGSEALAMGFADSVSDAISVQAKLSQAAKNRYFHIPQNLIDISLVDDDVQTIASSEYILNACHEAGFPQLSIALIGSSKTKQQIQDRMNEAKAILNLAKAAGVDEYANAAIESGHSLEQARVQFKAIRSERMAPKIISAHASSENFAVPAQKEASTKQKKLNSNDIYSKRKFNLTSLKGSS